MMVRTSTVKKTIRSGKRAAHRTITIKLNQLKGLKQEITKHPLSKEMVLIIEKFLEIQEEVAAFIQIDEFDDRIEASVKDRDATNDDKMIEFERNVPPKIYQNLFGRIRNAEDSD